MCLLTDVYITRHIRVGHFVTDDVVHTGLPDTHFILMDDLDFPPKRRGAVRWPVALCRVRLQASPKGRIVGEHIAYLNGKPGSP